MSGLKNSIVPDLVCAYKLFFWYWDYTRKDSSNQIELIAFGYLRVILVSQGKSAKSARSMTMDPFWYDKSSYFSCCLNWRWHSVFMFLSHLLSDVYFLFQTNHTCCLQFKFHLEFHRWIHLNFQFDTHFQPENSSFKIS